MVVLEEGVVGGGVVVVFEERVVGGGMVLVLEERVVGDSGDGGCWRRRGGGS